eukprot:gene2788-3079_t
MAIPVGTIPELQQQLFMPTGAVHVLGDAVSLLGAPLIPCLFLVLGANLAEGPGAAQVPPKLVAGMVASKLLLHPLAGMAVVLAALRWHQLPAGIDPLVPLVMMLNGEDQVSAFLFYQYLASVVTLPAFMAVYLELLQNGWLATA